jgi:hypothetical protein
MGIKKDLQNRVMDIPLRRLKDMQRIGKIPEDANITYFGGMVHVEFKIKNR